MTDEPIPKVGPRRWQESMAEILEEFGPGHPELIDQEKCRAIIADILKRYTKDDVTNDDMKAMAADLRVELHPHLEAAGPYAARAFVAPILVEFGRQRREARDRRMEGIPYVAIGADELGGPVGATHQCPGCGAMHAVRTEGPISGVKCSDGTLYLVGIDGRLITTAVDRKMTVIGMP